MIGIIGAMEEEIAAIKEYMQITRQSQRQGYIFYEGTMGKQSVVLLQGGIGKVNAAVSATLLMSSYPLEYVINIGSAGGLHSHQNVGDVVISSGVVHHDVDVTAFQREWGEVPGMPRVFLPSELLLKNVQSILQSLHIPYHIGCIASGDQFVAQEEQVALILKHFPQAVCAEMEAASIAQVCHIFEIPFLITRSLSDIYNKGENHVQFDEYLKKASQASAKMCYQLVSTLQQ